MAIVGQLCAPAIECGKREGVVAQVERERGIRILELDPVFRLVQQRPGGSADRAGRLDVALREAAGRSATAGRKPCSSSHEGSRLAMFVTLFGLTSDEGRDAPDASSKRHVVDVKGSRAVAIAGRGEFAPRRHHSIAIRRQCNSILQAAH